MKTETPRLVTYHAPTGEEIPCVLVGIDRHWDAHGKVRSATVMVETTIPYEGREAGFVFEAPSIRFTGLGGLDKGEY